MIIYNINTVNAGLYISYPNNGDIFDPNNIKIVLKTDGKGSGLIDKDVTLNLINKETNEIINLYNNYEISNDDIQSSLTNTYELPPIVLNEDSLNSIKEGGYTLQLIYNQDNYQYNAGGFIIVPNATPIEGGNTSIYNTDDLIYSKTSYIPTTSSSTNSVKSNSSFLPDSSSSNHIIINNNYLLTITTILLFLFSLSLIIS